MDLETIIFIVIYLFIIGFIIGYSRRQQKENFKLRKNQINLEFENQLLKAQRGDKESINISLDRNDYNELIRGKTVEKERVKIYLLDIGYEFMKYDLNKATEEFYNK